MTNPPDSQGANAQTTKKASFKKLAAYVLPVLAAIVFWIWPNANQLATVEKPKTTVVAPAGMPGPETATDDIVSVRVGINSKVLKGNEASVFSDCVPQFQNKDWVILYNEDDDFNSSITVKIVQVIERRNDPSTGCLFIGTEATRRIHLPRNQGIRTLRARKFKNQHDAKQAKNELKIPVELNFNVVKK